MIRCAQAMKLVIFDCDGTLVDSQHMICAAMQKAYSGVGLVCPPRERVLSIVGLSLPEAFPRLADGAVQPIDGLVEHYKSAFQALRATGIDMEPLYPGAREVVEGLADRANTVLGIATGKSVRGVRMVLGHHGLYEHFATVQTADTAPSKPHPGMILAAVRETGVAPRDAVMIGDTVFDIEMARAAGVAAIGVSWGYHPPAELRAAGADVVIEDFAQLRALLDRRWAVDADA
jgi:phosphoglycolate phosphatase